VGGKIFLSKASNLSIAVLSEKFEGALTFLKGLKGFLLCFITFLPFTQFEG
jgi:hypothetical protein